MAVFAGEFFDADEDDDEDDNNDDNTADDDDDGKRGSGDGGVCGDGACDANAAVSNNARWTC